MTRERGLLVHKLNASDINRLSYIFGMSKITRLDHTVWFIVEYVHLSAWIEIVSNPVNQEPLSNYVHQL